MRIGIEYKLDSHREMPTEFALVVAIIRCLALEAAEKKLHELGVRGMTVSKVKGYGEYANFYALDWMVDQVKIEVFVARDQVERIAGAILDAVHTGSPGDGIVAILPVETVLSARTRSEVIPSWLRG